MKNKIPNIYILGWKVGDNSFGCTSTYLELASKYGNAKILMPHELTPPKDCDLLIIPGGMDIAASSVGQFPGFMNSNVDAFKQNFYNNGLNNFVEAKIPILGICLGFQMLCAYFKVGRYKQNLQWHPSSGNRYEAGHSLDIYDDKFCDEYVQKLSRTKNKVEFTVNSHHHQGILIKEGTKEVGDIIIESVYENGPETVVEGFYHKYLPIVGVQHHPEEAISYAHEMYTKNIMNYLLNFGKEETKQVLLANVEEEN